MIIFENNNLLVIDKPAHVIVEDLAEKLKDDIVELSDLPRYGLAHRLDKETSGILLFGKNEKVLKSLKKSFKDRKVKKKYICLVWRRMKEEQGEIITSMRRGKNDRRKHQSYPKEEKGRRAISYYQVLENFENYSLIEVILKTGRRHQIRSQFAFLGHPVVGDKLYGFKDQQDPVEMNRHFLHNRFLEIETKEGIKRFESALPEDLKKVINKLTN
jgi:23S rRNA pseudouridine1911/1915/1917 synthase